MNGHWRWDWGVLLTVLMVLVPASSCFCLPVLINRISKVQGILKRNSNVKYVSCNSHIFLRTDSKVNFPIPKIRDMQNIEHGSDLS